MPPSAGSAQAITIDWVNRADDLPADLWGRCYPAPLEGLWWYRALERAGLEDQFTFAYAVISRGGTPVGIAPTFVMNLPLDIVMPDEIAPYVAWIGRWVPALRYQRTLFVGSPCAEEGTIGLVEGTLFADVMAPLMLAVDARAKAARVDMTVWKDMPDAVRPCFDGLVASGRLFDTPSFPGTEILALADSFEGYLARLGGNQRHQLRKKLKASRAALDLVATIDADPSPETHAEIWALFQQTYERAETRFERLTPQFFRELAIAPQTRFLLLRMKPSGQLAAFMLCYRDGDCATNKFIGIDYTLGEKVFLYFRLFEEFVVWATQTQARWLRSGQTGYRAKFDLGHTPVPLTNFARHRIGVLHWIYARVGRSITWSSLDPDLKTYLDAQARKGQDRKGDALRGKPDSGQNEPNPLP